MIKLTWFGTATILMEIDGEKLLFDPFFRMNKNLEQPKLEEFCDADFIFNTHSHFDHLCDLPMILKNSKAKLYSPSPAYDRLKLQGVDVENKVVVMKEHETLTTKNAKIKTYPSAHIKNNLSIVTLVALEVLFTFKIHKAYKLLQLHHQYLMGGKIYAYEIEHKGKKILLFGSAGIDKKVDLPSDVDVLIWPFQGRTGMSRYSLPIIERIKPKVVILDHFDDAFPPITGHVNTDKFVKIMRKKHPEIKVIVPQFRKPINLENYL